MKPPLTQAYNLSQAKIATNIKSAKPNTIKKKEFMNTNNQSKLMAIETPFSSRY